MALRYKLDQLTKDIYSKQFKYITTALRERQAAINQLQDDLANSPRLWVAWNGLALKEPPATTAGSLPPELGEECL